MSSEDLTLNHFNVNNIYFSIEYVGSDVGRSIVVVDLNGCSRNCTWCSHNKYNSLDKYLKYSIEDIVYRVDMYSTDRVKITGGEPTENKYLYELVKALKDFNFKVTIETNGDKLDKAFEIADNVIVDIKPYSAGLKTTTTIEQIDQLKSYGNVTLKGVIQNQADIDFYHSNFKNDDLWLFKEETKGRTELITDRLLLNHKWRICFRTDRLIGYDFDKAYKKLYG